MANKAKEQAIADIKQDLERNHKSFIAFRTELNPVMNKIVHSYSHLQQYSKMK